MANERVTLEGLPPDSVRELQGKQYLTHPALLALAHEHGIREITTSLVSYEEGEAIVFATAAGERGTYTGYGDASPANVSRAIASACVRMAETRAVNRCLRSYLGLGATTAEELPPESFAGRKGGKTPPSQRGEAERAARGIVEQGQRDPSCPKCGGPMWNNVQKKLDEGWTGPWFGCKDRPKCDGAHWDPPAGIDPPSPAEDDLPPPPEYHGGV